MKALKYGISLALVSGFAVIAGCGGSNDDGEAAGGASHSAGSGSGAASNNSDCPATAPADATTCALTGMAQACTYSGMLCVCQRARGGGGMMPGGMAGGSAAGVREWQCIDAPSGSGGRNGGAGGRNGGSAGRTGGGGGRTGGGGGSSAGGGRNGGGAGRNGGVAGATGLANCPATKPAADSACTGTDACPYTGGGCQCMSDKWTCL